MWLYQATKQQLNSKKNDEKWDGERFRMLAVILVWQVVVGQSRLVINVLPFISVTETTRGNVMSSLNLIKTHTLHWCTLMEFYLKMATGCTCLLSMLAVRLQGQHCPVKSVQAVSVVTGLQMPPAATPGRPPLWPLLLVLAQTPHDELGHRGASGGAPPQAGLPDHRPLWSVPFLQWSPPPDHPQALRWIWGVWVEAFMGHGAVCCRLECQGQPSLPGAVFCLDPVRWRQEWQVVGNQSRLMINVLPFVSVMEIARGNMTSWSKHTLHWCTLMECYFKMATTGCTHLSSMLAVGLQGQHCPVKSAGCPKHFKLLSCFTLNF